MWFTQSIAAAVLAFVAVTTAVSVPTTDVKELRAAKPLVESVSLPFTNPNVIIGLQN